MADVQSSTRYRHKSRGTTYTVIGLANLQHRLGRPLRDGDELVIYQGADGELWARHTDEFHDGRFEQAQP